MMASARFHFLKQIAVAVGPRVAPGLEIPCTNNPPDVIKDLGTLLRRIVPDNPNLPQQPTEANQQRFLTACLPILNLWADRNMAALREIELPTIQFPKPNEPYQRNLLLHEPDVYSIYIHVWGPYGRTQPHTHGKQIGLVLPIDSGIQELSLEMIGKPWHDGVDQFVRLRPAGKATALSAGSLQALTRDNRYLHVVQNSLEGFCRVMEIYIRPLKKIRLFEPTETPDVYRELIIRKAYAACVSRS